MGKICILSCLEIPTGKYNKEHLVPRSRVPARIANNPLNIHPCHKVLNCIKGNLLPCEFEEMKYSLSYHAIEAWNIKNEDKDFVRRAIINWEHNYQPNWCDICLLNCKGKQR